MRYFNYSEINDRKWDSEILCLVAAIYKEAGRQEMCLKQKPAELEKLGDIAKVQSAQASNVIEGIATITSTRIRQLAEQKTTPKNRDEEEMLGYLDAMNSIYESSDAGPLTSVSLTPTQPEPFTQATIVSTSTPLSGVSLAPTPLTRGSILQLHQIMYGHMQNPAAGRTVQNPAAGRTVQNPAAGRTAQNPAASRTKTARNHIAATSSDEHAEALFTPLDPLETPVALDELCAGYNRVIDNGELEPLLAVSVFIRDFLCIHPFDDGNGRMSRLLTTLLLYRSGFYVGKYVSLEAKIAASQNLYYEALQASQVGWHRGEDNPVPFIKYILGIVLAAYRDFDKRFALMDEKLSAEETVRRASKCKTGSFNKQDIRELCPLLSDSSIEGALRTLVASGELQREGCGKSTSYRRKDDCAGTSW